MKDPRTRRDVLGAGAGILATGALAGCLGSNTGSRNQVNASSAGSDELAATSSFAVLGDFASGVAGEVASVNTLVPVGQHGHGWSPSPQIQRAVLESDLFTYMAEGFQPWSDDIVTNIEDGGTNVTIVEARAGIDLLGVGSAHGHSESEHGHDHGSVNPHFWLDPQRSKQAVETIRDGFITADEENAQTYRENANAYTRRLDELDKTFTSALENTPKNTVLVAGHSAYDYLGHEYDFAVETLTGVSPDDQPTPQDIAHAQELIEEHSIEYILAPALESNQAATQLVQQTDAEGLLPITAMAGMTQEWQQKNWGYIDLMKNVNLPSLKRALGAK